MGHDNHHKKESKKVGFFDIFMGTLIFIGLWYAVAQIAGPEGFGFLKGKLNEVLAQEMLISGLLLMFLWAVMSPLVITPYLETVYDREARTSGMVHGNQDLKRDVEKLKAELVAEIKTARLEGVRRRDAKIVDAKRQASEIVEGGKKIADEEWAGFEKEIENLRSGLFSSIDNEVSALSSELIKKVLPSEISAKYHH